MTQNALSGSWLASRLGIDPLRVEALRRAGELIAVRAEGAHEWRYPAWQFDSEGKTKPAVRRLLAMARADRISTARVLELLDRRVGLVGGESVRELLLNGGEEQAIEHVRSAA